MYIITYSLRLNEADSDRFYSDIATFTDELLTEGEKLLKPAVESFTSKYVGGKVNVDESILELLILGTLWRVYSGDATGLDYFPKHLLNGLSQMRQRFLTLKPGIDFLKGIMSTLFLSPDLYDNVYSLQPKMDHLEKLLDWLGATGEFNQEVKRLKRWHEYLNQLPPNDSANILSSAITLALWFEVRSEEIIGAYTSNVDRYLNETRPERYWHEDVIFCGRRRVEYHLNMVGAEIMNRVFREEFLKTSKKMILLPACMRILPASRCRATSAGNGFRCTGCTSECSVHKLTVLGNDYSFDVMVMPHESSISAGKNSGHLFDPNTGVIGIACVLNLISGGWMLKGMDIPAQCVLLDYCGCKNHWHREGIPTEINMNQLKKVMGLNDLATKL